MGIDLNNEHGAYFGCSGTSWSNYLGVAEAFGWEPSSPLPPTDSPSWRGWYSDPAGQRMREADAHSLADALDRALDSELLEATLLRVWRIRPQDPEVWQMLYDGERRRIRDLSDFCRLGGFRIS